MAEMCKNGSAYFDARTGCSVGCLPPKTGPWIAFVGGQHVVATSEKTLMEGVAERQAFLNFLALGGTV